MMLIFIQLETKLTLILTSEEGKSMTQSHYLKKTQTI